MSGSSDEAQRAWIERVLGVTLPAQEPGGDLSARWQAARAEWLQASEAVEAQFAALRQALLTAEDPALQEIADGDLSALTKGLLGPMQAAVAEVDATGPEPGALDRLSKVVAAVGALVDGDERVAACDSNPFGVAMTLRPTLGDALAEMMRTIGRA